MESKRYMTSKSSLRHEYSTESDDHPVIKHDYSKAHPVEIWSIIFSFLDVKDRLNVSAVCSNWNERIKNTPYRGVTTIYVRKDNFNTNLTGLKAWGQTITSLLLHIDKGAENEISRYQRQFNSALLSCAILKSLEVVWPRFSAATSLRFLRHLHHIESLRLICLPCLGAHLDALVGCDSLETVVINCGDGRRENLSGLNKLPKLKEIVWSGILASEQYANILEPLSKCLRLEKVSLTSLSWHHVDNRTLAIDVSHLSNLSLTALNLSGMRIVQLAKLAKGPSRTRLLKLTLHQTSLLNTDLAVIANFSILASLNISCNFSLSDVRPIGQLKALKNLDLNSTGVHTIDALVGCYSLERINLYHSSVHEVRCLAACPNLEHVIVNLDTDTRELSKNVKVSRADHNIGRFNLPLGPDIDPPMGMLYLIHFLGGMFWDNIEQDSDTTLTSMDEIDD